MPSPKLSVRVPDETYSDLARAAEAERKSLTDLVRELIEEGLKRRSATPAAGTPESPLRLDVLILQVLHRMDQLENHQGQLIIKSARAAFESLFYSKVAMSFGNDIASMLIDQRVMDTDLKKRFLAEMEAIAGKQSYEYIFGADSIPPEPSEAGGGQVETGAGDLAKKQEEEGK